MKNRDALRTNKDFRKLKKEDKRQFFADHLNEESKGKLSDAVASTIKTGKEAGGDLIFNGNRLTVIQQKNFHRENFELVLESYDVLASAAKSGRFPEIPLVAVTLSRRDGRAGILNRHGPNGSRFSRFCCRECVG